MKRLSAALLIGLMFSSPAMAQSGDALIDGAKLCTRHLPRYERQYGIPTHLLSAIASTESGRYHQGLKISIPWPWTINAEGKGYYFDSKAEAIAFAQQLQRRGVVSMDVGCMQVNLYHHNNAFASLEDAFEPQNNIAYAASFLRGLYQDTNSWKRAAADYHSKTPQRGTNYVGLVYDKWYKIVDKLRSARMQVPDSATEVAMNEPVPEPRVTYINPDGTAAPAPVAQPQLVQHFESEKPRAIARLPEQAGKKLPTHHTPRMNSIALSDPKNDGVIVVKPSIKVVDGARPIQVAQAPSHNPGDAAVIRVASPTAGKKTGPTFIFND